jgi:phospholipid/cholesterol/gamma-HCH transport system substrate-binding protein
MKRNLIETVMGAVVLTVAGGFLAFAYNAGNVSPVNGYPVTAKFGSAAGINLGSDVRIGGIKVGVVSKMDLDPKSYQAVLTMEIKKNVQIPTDSSAAIATDGLLGGAYIGITPGGEEDMVKPGGTLEFTQSAVNLVDLIGKMVFSGGGVDGKKPAPGTPAASAAPAPAQPAPAAPKTE